MKELTAFWHVVVNSEKTVLAVYGSALESRANEFAANIRVSLGYARIVKTSKRPKVGDVLP